MLIAGTPITTPTVDDMEDPDEEEEEESSSESESTKSSVSISNRIEVLAVSTTAATNVSVLTNTTIGETVVVDKADDDE
jgi:CO dehydrogenase/acetyl-CoA synthase beta subunit